MKIKIAVAYYRECKYVEDEVFLPVQWGAYHRKLDLGIYKDSEMESLSKYNPYCSKMSATYWMRKNITDTDYYGLCHYRRFFSFESYKALDRFKQYLMYLASKALAPFIVSSRDTYSRSNGKMITTKDFKKSTHQLEDKIISATEDDNVEVFCIKKAFSSTLTYMMKLLHCIGVLNYNKLVEFIKKVDSNFYSYFLTTIRHNYYSPHNMTAMVKKYFDAHRDVVFTVLNRYGPEKDTINNMALGTSDYAIEYLTNSYILYLAEKGVKIKELHCTSIKTENSELNLGIEGLQDRRIKNFFMKCIMGGITEYIVLFDILKCLDECHHNEREMMAT